MAPVAPARHPVLDFAPLALVFGFLFAVSFLPPDTSKSEVDRFSRISVCMPSLYPPLVTAESATPGFDVDLVHAIAERNGWRVNVVSNSAMGRDFNPRHWRITRAQCQMLAGGIANTQTTSSFLDLTAPYLMTGWAFVGASGETLDTVRGPVGFHSGMTGLDRIGLGQYLRQKRLEVAVTEDAKALRAGLEGNVYSGAVTEALSARQVFADSAYETALLGTPLQSFGLGIGFWKGDLTLKQAVEETLLDMWRDGTVATIAARYDIDADLLCNPSEPECATGAERPPETE
ncbi:transporter substrate-binding domain-containing protein [Devosia sp. 2618]|uniref:substrate-binding periplasmic protein n=1 Tax=Devosia sp. 2618 TaxID=3156454 RepID=UPI00339427F0